MRASRAWLIVVVFVVSSTALYAQSFRQWAIEAIERLTSSSATAAELQILNRAKALVSAGQIDDAARLLAQRAARMEVAPGIAEPAAARLQSLSEALASRNPRPIEALITPARQLTLGGRLGAIAAGLTPDQTSMFASLNAVSALPLKTPRRVQASVRRFGQEFLSGARDPGLYVRERLQSLPPEKRWPIEQWLRSTHRHFVIAPNADTALVQELRAAVERDGGVAFFYQDCVTLFGQLCSAETVGAFFAMSHETLVSRSGAAAASAYIPVELLAAIRFQQGQDEIWFMVTPQEVQAAIAGGVAGASIAVIGTPPA